MLAAGRSRVAGGGSIIARGGSSVAGGAIIAGRDLLLREGSIEAGCWRDY